MLARLAYRLATEVSPRLAMKAAHLWVCKGVRTMRAHKRRVQRGELFPPFLFLALTNACNLRCRGCWIGGGGQTHSLSIEDVDAVIAAGKQQKAYFYTLLGGEPMIDDLWWDIVRRHSDCYFQIITNGMFLSERNVQRICAAGNATVLVSIDGWQEANDQRRGDGVFEATMEGLGRMARAKILFGVATTVTSQNLDGVLSDAYVREFIRRGAMYLWYYVYRPVGMTPTPEYCLDRTQMLMLRRRLLELRRREPIVLVDTYWDTVGEAVCPAALGLGFHIGPQGSIEPCPPLSFACETIHHDGRGLYRTINESQFLRGFQAFAAGRTRGCVILEHPRQLTGFLREMGARDYSGRDALAELDASEARSSHHIHGHQMPEDTWLYRMLKKRLFFGMGGYG